MNEVTERFLRYVSIDTQSSEESGLHPSSDKQKNLAELLFEELKQMGIEDVYYDKEHCYIYAKIKANDGGQRNKTLGFISHMDTSPETSGENINPKIIEGYDGKDIVLNERLNIILSSSIYPEIKEYKGKSLIVTDGTTLLGADDKAGIAEIMTMAHTLMNDEDIKHGPIAIAFTPDEEIGEGTYNFDIEKFGADAAYTVDGGKLGELEYETFNAASASVEVKGVNVHTGEAKNKMINAARIAEEFDSMLPMQERPEYTQDREGFYHLMSIEGSVEKAKISYLLRDHDLEKFEKRKRMINSIADMLNIKYGDNTVSVEIKDTYYNMRKMIEPDHMYLIEDAKKCMEELGIEPIVRPIRGGTDGASLSYKGLPCPNLCAGGHNFHGRYEYVCIESMSKIVELLIKLTTDSTLGLC